MGLSLAFEASTQLAQIDPCMTLEFPCMKSLVQLSRMDLYVQSATVQQFAPQASQAGLHQQQQSNCSSN
jgi:hypothetical protein